MVLIGSRHGLSFSEANQALSFARQKSLSLPNFMLMANKFCNSKLKANNLNEDIFDWYMSIKFGRVQNAEPTPWSTL